MSVSDSSPTTNHQFTVAMDRALLDSLLEAKNNNERVEGGNFKNAAWARTLDAVRDAQPAGDSPVGRKNLHNRFSYLKAKYRRFQEFAKSVANDWSWDDSRNTYRHDPEVMRAYFAEDGHKEFRQFRDRGPTCYNKIRVFCSEPPTPRSGGARKRKSHGATDDTESETSSSSTKRHASDTMMSDAVTRAVTSTSTSTITMPTIQEPPTQDGTDRVHRLMFEHHFHRVPTVTETAIELFHAEHAELLPRDWRGEDGQIPHEKLVPFYVVLSIDDKIAQSYVAMQCAPRAMRYDVLIYLMDRHSSGD